MKQAIIIATHNKFKPWLLNFIKTYDSHYDLLFTYNTDVNNICDVKALITGIESDYDEFLVFHDTIEIKDNKIFDIIFEQYKGRSVYLRKLSCMFLAKYTKTDLAEMPSENMQALYKVTNKKEGVNQEDTFNNMYKNVSNPIYLFDDFKDNPVRENKFGRNNMIIENEYLKKYKGSWNMDCVLKSYFYVPTMED